MYVLVYYYQMTYLFNYTRNVLNVRKYSVKIPKNVINQLKVRQISKPNTTCTIDTTCNYQMC